MNYDLGDVHDFILDNFCCVGNAQLFGAEHASHWHDCFHDLDINNKLISNIKIYSNKNNNVNILWFCHKAALGNLRPTTPGFILCVLKKNSKVLSKLAHRLIKILSNYRWYLQKTESNVKAQILITKFFSFYYSSNKILLEKWQN